MLQKCTAVHPVESQALTRAAAISSSNRVRVRTGYRWSWWKNAVKTSYTVTLSTHNTVVQAENANSLVLLNSEGWWWQGWAVVAIP